ncbi:MAG TPA: MFS transporter [Gammaproteobacteria bacterium]|nr:MFS transporter [Gammaproteobacteria bacterium]
MTTKMTVTEKRAVISLSLIMALRMIGLFMIVPLFALYAKELSGSTPLLIGLALGIYGITQAFLQIPFGLLSDRFGRRRIITLGLLLFALGSLIAALSSSIYGVILGRALQGGGAIGSTLMAMIADLTREEQRTKVMAISGMTIGLSIALAIVIGPILVQWLPVQSLFWLAFGFSLFGILILYTWAPQAPKLAWQAGSESEFQRFFTLLKHPDLLRLNGGIFFLHAIFTASFVALPISFDHFLGWSSQEQWKLYLPALLLAFAVSLVLIALAEKQRRVKPYFLGAILALALAEGLLGFFPSQLFGTGLGLCLFLTAFSLLEAFLPSLVSRTAPSARKGTAMGLYSCSQFLGIFAGGLWGGWLYEHAGLLSIFPFSLMLCLLWLLFAYRMTPQRYFITRILKLQFGSWPELASQLQRIPGIAEMTFHPEEKLAYLKVENHTLRHPDFLRIEQALQHPHH